MTAEELELEKIIPSLLKNGVETDIQELWVKDLPEGSKAHPETVGMFRYFTPDGIANLSHASIIASSKFETYKVLPSYAGLIQLMEDGKIERAGFRSYLVKSEFERFPARLNGARSVKFTLDKGVSLPKGDPGHSCIFLSETGKPIEGSSEICFIEDDDTSVIKIYR